MQIAFNAAVVFVLKFSISFKLALAILCDRPQPGHQFFYNLQISFKRYRISFNMRFEYVAPSMYLEIFQHMIWQSLVKRIKIMTSEFVSESVIQSILNVNTSKQIFYWTKIKVKKSYIFRNSSLRSYG